MNPEETAADLFEREMRVLGYPCEHGNATGHIQFYKLCHQFGIRTLLSGFGGDEVGTNPGHLLSMELIDAKRYGLWYQNTPGNPLWRLLRMVKQGYAAYQRRQGRYQSHIEKACLPRMEGWILAADARQKYQVDTHYRQALRYDADHRSINAFILGDRLAPFVPTRLDNCTLMAASYQVDYRWPLLDRRLMQQYLSTPAIEKYSARASRYLHRRAVDDVLPHKVCWKPTKYMGEPVRSAASATRHNHSPVRRDDLTQMTLHPALEPLVDQNKLQTLVQQLQSMANPALDPTRFMVARQIHALKQLDQWLQYYF